MSQSLLPPGFEGLEPFVERWAITGSAARAEARGSATPEERETFFAAAAPMLQTALAHLDAKPLDAFDPADERLMNLVLALTHVAMAVEVHGDDESRMTQWRKRMRITRSPADASHSSSSRSLPEDRLAAR